MDFLGSLWKPMAKSSPTSSSPLDSLPPEMLHLIMALLTPTDVASTRLACSLLATVGAEHLTNEVRLVYEPESFATLKTIAAHPVSKAIKSLIFQADRVNEYPTLESWISGPELVLLDDKTASYSRCIGSIMNGILECGQRYAHSHTSDIRAVDRSNEGSHAVACQLFKDQQQIAESGSDVQHLIYLFRRCPRLDSVETSIGNAHRGRNLKLMDKLIQAGVEPAGDIIPYKAGVHHVKTICVAAKEATRSLKSFTAYDLGYQFLQQDNNDTEPIRSVFRGLHKIRLGFAAAFDEFYWDGDQVEELEDASEHASLLLRQGALRNILASMPLLRVLRLRLPPSNPDEDLPAITTLKDAVGPATWPKLRDIGVAMTLASEDGLVDFLLRHSAKLRRLSLSCITLMDGNWKSLFTRISGQFPRLHKVKLSGALMLCNGARVWDEFAFPAADAERKPLPIREALQNYIREGGDYPDLSSFPADEEEEDAENDSSLLVNLYKRAMPVQCDEDDGGYDSDGSHIFYGSDDFDLQI